jgi:flavorubredoxin
MEGFHKRYMASNKVMKAWAEMVRPLDIEIIAPQHGAFFKGKEMVRQFIDWCANLPCGVDLMTDQYRIPEAE